MMPDYIDPGRDLDPGIRDLVVSMARLPGSVTWSNCEGHERYAPPLLPSKGGRCSFDLSKGEYDPLLDKMEQLTQEIRYNGEPIFSLNRWGDSLFCPGKKAYSLSSKFEETPGFETVKGRPFKLTEEGKKDLKNYLRRSKNRKPLMLEGWSRFNDLVLEYIRETITLDVESLSFR